MPITAIPEPESEITTDGTTTSANYTTIIQTTNRSTTLPPSRSLPSYQMTLVGFFNNTDRHRFMHHCFRMYTQAIQDKAFEMMHVVNGRARSGDMCTEKTDVEVIAPSTQLLTNDTEVRN